MMRIGRKAKSSLSYLLPVTHKDNSTTLKLDENRDLRAGSDEKDLVLYRQKENGNWQWEPVKNTAELQAFMSQASTEEKQNHLGLWKDSKRFFVFPGDGKIQDKEVTSMGQRWSEMTLSDHKTEYNHDKGYTSAWMDYYSNVVPEKVNISEKALATGKVLAFEEPRKYVETEVERVTDWKLTGDGWRPRCSEVTVYNAKSRQGCRN